MANERTLVPQAPDGSGSLQAGAADPLVGCTIAGRFRIQALIGSGGAARVYQATQEPLGREVALKVVRPDVDEVDKADFERRFLREAALAGRLSHPNVVTVYDFGRADDGTCWIAMELLRGRTLRKALSTHPGDPAEAVRLILGVARGLRHAHASGMVHRDIKPGNVFLVLDDEGVEQPRILDFGLVKDEGGTSITDVGTMMGTPHYISPEQATGRADVDGRSDVYSLGVMLYRMLAGSLPYEADHPMGIAMKHVRDAWPPFSTKGVKVDSNLELIVERCMAKDPPERPSSSELVRLLEAWSGGGPSPDLSTAELTPSTLNRAPAASHSWPWVVGAVVLALGLGGGAVALLSRGQEEPAPVAQEAALEPLLPSTPETPAAKPPPAEAAAPPPVPGTATPLPAPATPAPPAPRAEAPSKARSEAVRPVKAVEPPPAPAPLEPPARPPAGATLAYDDVRMSPGQAAATLAWINSAPEDAIRKAGISGQQANILLSKRPFASMDAFAATPYIGEKTVRAALEAAAP